MKKVPFILFIAFSINTFGQKHAIGIQGGLNLTHLTAKESFDDIGFRTGFKGGLAYELKFRDRYQFGAGLLYSQQGFTDKFIFMDDFGNVTGESENFEYNYDYLKLPLKLGYEIGGKLKLVPRVGLVPSILIQAEVFLPIFDSEWNIIGKETIKTTDKVSKFDFAGLLELGFDYGLSEKLWLCSSVAYERSITTFSNADYFAGNKMRHYGFSLSVGLKRSL
jgi:hypothetical protein